MGNRRTFLKQVGTLAGLSSCMARNANSDPVTSFASEAAIPEAGSPRLGFKTHSIRQGDGGVETEAGGLAWARTSRR